MDLVQRKVSVIAAGWPSGPVAKAATKEIPIVFMEGGDPIRDGLATSMNHPGENLTGAIMFASDLEEKRLALLHELVPGARKFGAVVDSNLGDADFQLNQFLTAAKSLNLEMEVFKLGAESDFDGAFAAMPEKSVGALIFAASTLFNTHRRRLVELSNRYKLPTAYELREFTQGGGLMSYSPNLPSVVEQSGVYVGRILQGERVGDLPVVQPTKFELVINLKTARALGIEVPPKLLFTADEVIE